MEYTSPFKGISSLKLSYTRKNFYGTIIYYTFKTFGYIVTKKTNVPWKTNQNKTRFIQFN